MPSNVACKRRFGSKCEANAKITFIVSSDPIRSTQLFIWNNSAQPISPLRYVCVDFSTSKIYKCGSSSPGQKPSYVSLISIVRILNKLYSVCSTYWMNGTSNYQFMFLKEVVNKYHVKGSWKILSNGSYEGYSYK